MISKTEKIVAGGSCLARIDGKAVFVPLSLPGETLDLRIVLDKKEYAFAEVIAIVEGSPHRRRPPCPLFSRCGGCSLQMADEQYQRELRMNILESSMSRAHVPFAGAVAVESGAEFEYRSRFQFHRTADGEPALREESSNKLVGIRDCPVAVPSIRNALTYGRIREWMNRSYSEERFQIFGTADHVFHQGGDTECQVTVNGVSLYFDIRGFFQSNMQMLGRLADWLKNELDSRFGGQGQLLDFYAGVGTFSRLCASAFSRSVLVEHNRGALSCAEKNLKNASLSATLCCTGDDAWPVRPEARQSYDCLIIDPPRQGIGPGAMKWISTSGIPDIYYVSCDPVTFSRDAKRLVDSGYVLETVRLFDFYPQTHHVETLGVFRRDR